MTKDVGDRNLLLLSLGTNKFLSGLTQTIAETLILLHELRLSVQFCVSPIYEYQRPVYLAISSKPEAVAKSVV